VVQLHSHGSTLQAAAESLVRGARAPALAGGYT
jgi:hypothetical protein